MKKDDLSEFTDEIMPYLQASDFFKNLPLEKLRELSKQFELQKINSGEILIHEGDLGDCMYMVISGRFSTSTLIDNEYVKLQEIGRGELIGEMALLTQLPRSITIIAVRDSILLKLSREAFNSFINNNPERVFTFTHEAISRLLKRKKSDPHLINSITIAPAGTHVRLQDFVVPFVEVLKKYGTTLYLNSKIIRDMFKEWGEVDTGYMEAIIKNPKLTAWINKREIEYTYIVYETDLDSTVWTKYCFRQADRIVFVGANHKDKSLNVVEHEFYLNRFIIKRNRDLIILYDEGTSPENTGEWLQLRNIDNKYHIRKNCEKDFARLIRIITGQAVGLVLGGGGARSIAHAGVYKALSQIGIPVDLVGGSSFGAIVGCIIATDCTVEYLIESLRENVSENKKIFNRTLPLLSFYSGINLSQNLKNFFGENTYIEDLWKQFFCVVCNLTRSSQEVHQTGLIWKAIRASVSLPVIVPPITNAQNDVLVDGGLINNLPTDVMRTFSGVGKIIAASTSFTNPFKANIPEGILSGSSFLYQRYLKKDRENFPNIVQILLKSIGVSSSEHETKMIEAADYGILIKTEKVDLLDFKPIDLFVEAGYRATMELLDNKAIDELLSVVK